MSDPSEFHELPRSGNHNCFGCSPVNPVGLRMRFFSDGKSVLSRLAVPEHLCGWSRIVHGGVLGTILDEVMSWAAIHLLQRIALTRTLTVEYVKPATVGTELEARAWVREAQGNDAATEAEIRDAGGDLCARAIAHFKVFSPAVTRRLQIADEASIAWFEKLFGRG